MSWGRRRKNVTASSWPVPIHTKKKRVDPVAKNTAKYRRLHARYRRNGGT
jgi:hypothetical protein